MDNFEAAIKALKEPGVTCAAAKDGKIFTSGEDGIKPLLIWLSSDERFLEGAAVADRVVGKAAALLLIKSKAAQIYAGIISESAAKVFAASGKSFSFRISIPFILNRAGTGMCPMESAVLREDDPEKAYLLLKRKAGL